MKIIRLVVLILFLSTQLLACSERDWDEGVEAYKRGDYVVALVKWRPLAEQGRNNAQYWLGQMYYKGHGVSQDDKEAANWYRKAAQQGYVPAQYNLGSLYHTGPGVAQDYKEAMKWFRKAAEQGSDKSKYRLDAMYAQGQGLTQDNNEAVNWCRKAAEKGHFGAQIKMGYI